MSHASANKENLQPVNSNIQCDQEKMPLDKKPFVNNADLVNHYQMAEPILFTPEKTGAKPGMIEEQSCLQSQS
jgi:hypothetical protein